MAKLFNIGGEVFIEGGGLDKVCVSIITVVSREVGSNKSGAIILDLLAVRGNMVV